MEGTILFPDALAGFADIENGNSIVNLWIESPRIVSPGRLTFAGITPGGYIGDNGLIFSLVLRAKNAGEGQMKLSNFRALISDGWGTPAAAKSNDFTLKIIEIIALFPSPSVIGPSEDNAPPEYFEPLLYQDSYMFDGQWFIVFNAEDKGMGMDHYEILETKVPGTHNQKWLNAASPYVLKDQALESYIYVKAVDKKGNERIETLAPKNPALWFEKYLVWVILLVVAAVIYFVNKFLWKTQKK